MCCDGTLFNSVTLVPDDLPKLEKYKHLLELKIRSEQATYDEPCPLHTAAGCSAYEDRPATCERYHCGVLRSVMKNELSEAEALLIIAEGKALVAEVKQLVPFEAGMPLAVSTWEQAPDGLNEEARSSWERTAHHLGKHFLNTVKKDVVAPPLLPRRSTRESLFKR